MSSFIIFAIIALIVLMLSIASIHQISEKTLKEIKEANDTILNDLKKHNEALMQERKLIIEKFIIQTGDEQ